MSAPARMTWTDIRQEVLRRLTAREWKPGELIPTEATLAQEFGCARATVNRALRSLAETGLIDRRRKAGTRVAQHPVRKASFSIPMLRKDIEGRGQVYGYRLLSQDVGKAPAEVRERVALTDKDALLHVASVHLADGQPHVFEDRWINLTTMPSARAAPFDVISANEWLLLHAAYSHGEIAFAAEAADARVAEILRVDPGAAVFVMERTTWNMEIPVTTVRQIFAPGYRLHTTL